MKWMLLMVGLSALVACTTDKVDGRIGAICDGNEDCTGGARCLLPSAEWPGGMCTVSCNVDDDCTRDDVVCADEEGGACLFLCRDDRDCDFLDPTEHRWLCKETAAKAGGPSVLACRGGS